jgi:FkbM family methyltransferase
VQAGGYVGLWPMRLAKSFARVLTFEVMPGCLEACRRNCAPFPNITVSGLGLSSTHGETLPILAKSTAGSWRVSPEGDTTARMTTIDTLGLTDCDAIILDVEGHELEALRGAEQTIARTRPVIHLEQLTKHGTGAHDYLTSLGYRPKAKVHKDTIYVPD